jgi:hypothetical protein
MTPKLPDPASDNRAPLATSPDFFKNGRSGCSFFLSGHSFFKTASGARRRHCKGVSGRFGVIRVIAVPTGRGAMIIE